MMSGYDTFKITTIDVITETKTIIINFNQDINPDTISYKNITLIDENNGALLIYNFLNKGTSVNLVLHDWPGTGAKYLLNIKDITNVLDEPLEMPLSREITFTNTITSIITILSPSNFENIINSVIQFKEENPDGELYNSYYIEIAKENAFYNVVISATVNKTTYDFAPLPQGQYYVRCRVQTDNDYGSWSNIVTFIVEDPQTVPGTNLSPTVIDELNIISTLENGYTPETILIEFDDSINADTLGEITLFRREL